MEIASNIASTSIVIPAYFVSAGIALFTGILFVVMRLVGRQQYLYLAFAVMCFCAAGFQFTAAEYYMAKTISDASTAQLWQITFLAIFFPAFYIFVARYTGQQQFKPWLALIILFYGGMLVFNWTTPYSLRFSTLEMIEPLRLPWGETLARY